jgi:hypothetical protein
LEEVIDVEKDRGGRGGVGVGVLDAMVKPEYAQDERTMKLLEKKAADIAGRVWTWGGNFYMQVGHDKSNSDLFMTFDDKEVVPGEISLPLQYLTDAEQDTRELSDRRKKEPKSWILKQVACGGWHTLLLAEARNASGNPAGIYSWGTNGYGQLGLGKHDREELGSHQFPTLINMPDKSIVKVAAGAFHSAALSDDGKVLVWGQNRGGQLGPGYPHRMTYPVLMDHRGGSVVDLACGAFHTLLLTEEGELYSYGKFQIMPSLPLHIKLDPHFMHGDIVMPTHRGETVEGKVNFPSEGEKKEGGKKITQICAGNGISAVIKGGKMYMWKIGGQPEPVKELEDKKIVKIALSWSHAAAVTEHGGLYMWALEPVDLVEPAEQGEEDDDRILEIDERVLYQQQQHTSIMPEVRLPSYRGGRGYPKPGTVASPLHRTHAPTTSTTPVRMEKLAKEMVVDVALGWNFVITTTVPRLRAMPRRRPSTALLEYYKNKSRKPQTPNSRQEARAQVQKAAATTSRQSKRTNVEK